MKKNNVASSNNKGTSYLDAWGCVGFGVDKVA